MSGMAKPQCPGKCSRGYKIRFWPSDIFPDNLFCTEFIYFYFSNSGHQYNFGYTIRNLQYEYIVIKKTENHTIRIHGNGIFH